jgi:hypothetical protein
VDGVGALTYYEKQGLKMVDEITSLIEKFKFSIVEKPDNRIYDLIDKFKRACPSTEFEPAPLIKAPSVLENQPTCQKVFPSPNLSFEFQCLLSKFRDSIEFIAQPKPLSLDELGRVFNDFKEAYLKTHEMLSLHNPRLNIWKELRIGRDEVENCRILSWFLNENAEHMQSNRFFKCLLRTISGKTGIPEEIAQERYYLRREDWLSDNERVDIFIYGQTFNLVIEAKIDASLGDLQLERYWREAQGKSKSKNLYALFLTKDPVDISAPDHRFCCITWRDISKALSLFSGEKKDAKETHAARNPFVNEIALQYANYIKQHFIRR